MAESVRELAKSKYLTRNFMERTSVKDLVSCSTGRQNVEVDVAV